MNERLTAIAQRRSMLVERAAGQRDEMSGLVRPWQRRLALADRGVSVARRLLHAHPLAIAAGAAGLILMWRGRLGVWGASLWNAWAVYRSLQKPRRPETGTGFSSRVV